MKTPKNIINKLNRNLILKAKANAFKRLLGIFSRCPACGARFSKKGEVKDYDSSTDTVTIVCSGCGNTINIVNSGAPENIQCHINPYRMELETD